MGFILMSIYLGEYHVFLLFPRDTTGYKVIPYFPYSYSSLQLLSRLLIAPSQCLQNLEQCA